MRSVHKWVWGGWREVAIVGLIGIGPVSACSPGAAEEDIANAEQAICTYYPACTATTSSCNLGRWPGGVIYYAWDSGDSSTSYNKMARQAMTDWENAASHTIQFIEDITANPHMTIHANGGTGRSGYYSGFDSSNVYHELGHVIGLKHEFQRADREHYVIVRNEWSDGTTMVNCADEGNTARCGSDSAVGGIFGPFDFKSSQLYGPTHPDISRWDNSPIVPGPQCGERPEKYTTLPAQCTNSDCTGSSCVALPGSSGYTQCPTCGDCSKLQPYGFPTKQDGSAVVEFYTPSWGIFSRMVNDDYGSVPFDNTLAPGVTIAANSNPAVETWENASLAVYVLGSDHHIYQRWRTDNSSEWWHGWSGWMDHGGNFTSSPSVVSWGAGRSDLVARGAGNAIFIKTYSNGAWGGWQSLGGISASSPSITSWGPDRLDIFTRTTSNALQVKSCTGSCNGSSGSWTGWQTPFAGGTFRGRPSALSRGTGFNDILVQGMDGTLWGNWYHSTGVGNWYQVNPNSIGWNSSCPECYSPAASARATEIVDVFVRGQDDKAWVITWSGNVWGGYSPLGGVLASSPGAFPRVRSSNRNDLVIFQREETTAGSWMLAPWWKQFRYPPPLPAP